MHAAAVARRCLAALVLAVLLAFLLATRADAAPRAASALLAPSGACPSADDPAAPAEVQVRAMSCLINWARARASRSRLGQPRVLRHAAVLKARKVASCGQFSHTPCGADAAASVRAAGYRFKRFGENLYVGAAGRTTARAVVLAWLNSPGHRANILQPRFRHVGAGLVRAERLLGGGAAYVWVAEFASPR